MPDDGQVGWQGRCGSAAVLRPPLAVRWRRSNVLCRSRVMAFCAHDRRRHTAAPSSSAPIARSLGPRGVVRRVCMAAPAAAPPHRCSLEPRAQPRCRSSSGQAALLSSRPRPPAAAWLQRSNSRGRAAAAAANAARELRPRRSARAAAAAAAPATEPDAQQQLAAAAAEQQRAVADAVAEARRVLTALSNYAPTSLDDGPASLAKVLPYDAARVDAALQHASRALLGALPLQQLANLGAALAAAGHCDARFMRLLGDVAAERLAAAPAATEHAPGLAAFRALAWLAAGFARLGQLHPPLMEQLALRGAELLRRRPMAFSKPAHGRQLALLAASFASLRLYPPQLFRALGEHLKLQRHVLRLLGPREAMLLLWAFGRARHRDPAAQLLLVQRAAAMVGQLDCRGLAHAWAQCAAVGIAAPPLLAALRKCSRQRLHAMQPEELLALLAALAALGQQDALFLDEIARAVHNKAANFAAEQLSASLAAMAALRYRNPWLLERLSKVLVSRRLNKAPFLSPQGLALALAACAQLEHRNPLLLSHLAAVAAGAQVPRCDAPQLAALLGGYVALRFQQPQLLQAAAARLLELAAAQQAAGAGKQPDGSALRGLVTALHALALLPSPAGSAAERLVLPAAALAVAARAVEQPRALGCGDAARLFSALLCITADAGLQQEQQQQQRPGQLLDGVREQLLQLQAAVQQQLAIAAAAGGGLTDGGDREQLLQAMQLVWLSKAASGQQQQQAPPPGWQLDLPDDAVHALLSQQPQPSAAEAVSLAVVSGALLQLLQQQDQVAGAELATDHRLPGSPIVLPLALTWRRGSSSLSSAAEQLAVVDVPAAALQQRGGPLQQQQGLLEAAELLRACAREGTPLAVFLDDGRPPAWHTANAPRRLLPAAALWARGLAGAGWAVLVVRPDDEADAGE